MENVSSREVQLQLNLDRENWQERQADGTSQE